MPNDKKGYKLIDGGRKAALEEIQQRMNSLEKSNLSDELKFRYLKKAIEDDLRGLSTPHSAKGVY